jgi:hypothetical protein
VFERYTEKARQTIFFARYEASQFGSPYIEPEHILLGLLRADKALSNRFLRPEHTVEGIGKQIWTRTPPGEKVSTSVDLPLSNESKNVLAHAAEAAEDFSDRHIGTQHLLLGLLHEEQCFAAQLLRERGLQWEPVREKLRRDPHSGPDAVKWEHAGVGLVINSSPSGADIEVDGTFYGHTPAQLPLPEGERTVRIKLAGFQPWERKVQVMQGARQSLTATLERLPS